MGSMEHPGSRARLMRGGHRREDRSYGQPQPETSRFTKQIGPSNAAGSSSLLSELSLSVKDAFSLRRRSGSSSQPSRVTESSPSSAPLPIMLHEQKIRHTVAQNKVSILIAPTGTGKSTMLPLFLLKDGYERIIITNPRRTPCVELARRVSELDNTPLGSKIGYRHGRHSNVSSDSQIVFTTEGYQLKRELQRSERPNTVYVLDEFHEFTANAVILLALLKERITCGEDIKIVIATATLDSAQITEYLSNSGLKAPVVEIHAKHHHIHDIPPGSSIAEDVASSRNSLTFLVGKAQIKQTDEQVTRLNSDLRIVHLHAELPYHEQREALRAEPTAAGKAVLATNCAQTSLTFPNLERVIISGHVRQETLDDEGIRSLVIRDISQAELKQQRGRVGRTQEGECVYHGTPIEELAPQVPAEIQHSSLDEIVLRLLASGRIKQSKDFSIVNQSLLTPAPQGNINLATQSLYHLDLTGPQGHITELGRTVAELPVATRTGKIVALALQISKQLNIPPQDLLIPAIDVAAVMEAQGIVSRGSSLLSRDRDNGAYVRQNRWMKFCSGDQQSDPLAQMQVFQRIAKLPVAQFQDWGIHPVHFQRALDVRVDLCDRLNLDPKIAAAEQLPDAHARLLKECIWRGMIDRMYRFVGVDEYDSKVRWYKPVVGDGKVRTLSKDSLIRGARWIVAEPINIDKEPYDDDPLRLLTMASKVNIKWVKNHHPPQLKNDILESLDKTPERKHIQDSKDDSGSQKFFRPSRNRGKRR